MEDFIQELMEEIQKAEEVALANHIKTNAVILNKDFDIVKDFYAKINGHYFFAKPMIFGKHIFIGKLPKDYSFMITEVNEKAYETELEYYKNKCVDLETKLESIKELLQ